MAVVLLVGWLAWSLALSGYDIRRRRLPNRLTLPGAAVVLLVAVIGGCGGAALAGAVSLGAVYLLVHLVSPTSLGGGDVKLALAVGALTGCFGADVWILAALAAPLLTVPWAVAARVRCGARTVPHGPVLCLVGAAVLVLAAF